MQKVSSKKGLITVPNMRKEINSNLGYEIKNSSLKKIINQDINLSWQRIHCQEVYFNTPANIELRKQYANLMISQL